MNYLPAAIADPLSAAAYSALDNGRIPDPLVRRAIRHLCNQRLDEIASTSLEVAAENKWTYIAGLKRGAIAIEQAKANEQHYEVSRPC
jgi:hypothetical protein